MRQRELQVARTAIIPKYQWGMQIENGNKKSASPTRPRSQVTTLDKLRRCGTWRAAKIGTASSIAITPSNCSITLMNERRPQKPTQMLTRLHRHAEAFQENQAKIIRAKVCSPGACKVEGAVSRKHHCCQNGQPVVSCRLEQ